MPEPPVPGPRPPASPGASDAPVHVVAAVVRRGDACLLGRRPPHKRHGGLWEFPGGKMRDGESLLQASRRELREELHVEAVGAGRVLWSGHDAGSPFVIHFLEVEIEGEPSPTEHVEVGWFTAAEMRALPLAPTDRAFVEAMEAEGAVEPPAPQAPPERRSST